MSLLIRVLGIFNGPDSRLPGKFSTECFAAFVVFLPGLGSEILVRCDPEATKLRFPCPFVPEALLPHFGDICFSLGISPNAFRLILELRNSIRPIVESDLSCCAPQVLPLAQSQRGYNQVYVPPGCFRERRPARRRFLLIFSLRS